MTRENLLVVYCDGSARPTNPGFAGYGLFGYVLKEAARPKNINYPVRGAMKFTSRGIITKAISNSFSEPLPGGKTITRNLDKESYECLDIIEVIASLQDPQGTNNQAELLAANEAMRLGIERDDVNSILIVTDSEYVVAGGLGRVDTWKKNGWRTSSGKLASNLEMWKEFDALKTSAESLGITIDFRWVKGHIGEEGNEIVDVYAVVGAVRARVHADNFNSLETMEPHYIKTTTTMTEFRKQIADIHPIYDYKSFMFYTLREENLDNVAVLLNFKEATDIGKRTMDNSYAILVNDVPNELKDVREAFRGLPRQQENLSRINLDIIKQDKLFCRLVTSVGYMNAFNPIEQRLRSPRFVLGPVIHFPSTGRKKDDDEGDKKKKETKPTPPVFVEEYNRLYPFLMEVEDTLNLLNISVDTLQANIDDGSIIDLTDLFFNSEEKDPLTLKFRDKSIDITDRITHDKITLVSRPVLHIGKDTPPYSFFKSVAPKADKVFLHIDTQGYGNCATFVLFVVYRNSKGEPAMIAHTNLLGKFLFKHKEITQTLE